MPGLWLVLAFWLIGQFLEDQSLLLLLLERTLDILFLSFYVENILESLPKLAGL